MISEEDVKFPNIPFGKTAVLILIGLVIYFLYLYYFVGFGNLLVLLKSISLPLLCLALVVSLCGNLFHAAGWWVLLRDTGHRISLGWAYLIYLSSIFFTNLVPSAAASGEIAKLYFVQKKAGGSRFDRTLAAGIMSRLLEVVPVAVGTILGVIYVALYYTVPIWVLAFCLLVALLVCFTAVLVLAVCMNAGLLKTLASAVVSLVSKLFRKGDHSALAEKIDALATQFDGSMREITGKKITILKALALIMIAWCFDVTVAYIAFRAIGYQIPPGLVVTIYCIMVLLQLVPIPLPGGLGFLDSVMPVLYRAMGVDKASANNATIVTRVVTLWFLTAVGGLVTLYLARMLGTGGSTRPKRE